MRLNFADEGGAALRIDVKFVRDVAEGRNEIGGAIVAVHAGECVVSDNVVAVDSSLEDAFDGVFEDRAEALFGALGGELGAFALLDFFRQLAGAAGDAGFDKGGVARDGEEISAEAGGEEQAEKKGAPRLPTIAGDGEGGRGAEGELPLSPGDVDRKVFGDPSDGWVERNCQCGWGGTSVGRLRVDFVGGLGVAEIDVNARLCEGGEACADQVVNLEDGEREALEILPAGSDGFGLRGSRIDRKQDEETRGGWVDILREEEGRGGGELIVVASAVDGGAAGVVAEKVKAGGAEVPIGRLEVVDGEILGAIGIVRKMVSIVQLRELEVEKAFGAGGVFHWLAL